MQIFFKENILSVRGQYARKIYYPACDVSAIFLTLVMGTFLSEDHIRLIKKLGYEVILMNTEL